MKKTTKISPEEFKFFEYEMSMYVTLDNSRMIQEKSFTVVEVLNLIKQTR